MSNNPVSVLFDKFGNSIGVVDDGGVYRLQAEVIGSGVAGVPAPGVITVQGIVGGIPIPIDGSITATNPSVSLTGAAVPASATLIGAGFGGNLIALRVAADGTLRIDPSGTTTQPVSAASLPLPSGAATEITLATLLTSTTFTSRINTLGQKAMTASMPVVIASDQSPLEIKHNTHDVFSSLIIGQRNNQVEVSFYQGTPSDLVSVTTTAGGTATSTQGHALFSTGTNTNGTSKGISLTSVTYRPLHEVYAAFSAAFTAGVSGSNQRIGIFNDVDGFYVGYEGTQFGISTRRNSISTFVAATSFSEDPLDGSAGSLFTRNGSPEPIALANANVFLITFGWLGSAPIKFSVLSPDGDWVAFHTIRQPNTTSNASVTNPTLPLRVEANKSGAGATDIIVTTACWAAGTTSSLSALGETITSSTLATLTKSVILAKKPNQQYAEVTANTNGRLLVSNDSVGATGAAVPTSATLVGSSDGVNIVAIRSASDGTLRVDPTGTTVQPVSGTVTANAGTGTFAVSAVALPLPSGAATETTLATRLAEATFTTRINTLGQKTMANSTPVVLSSNQSPIDVVVVSGSGGSNLKMAYDIGETVIYIGEAELGSATNASVWTIKRITLVGGEPTFTEWSDGTAVWDDRTTEIYS